MKSKLRSTLFMSAALALSALNFESSVAYAQSTAFSYQGQLMESGAPANGVYDLQFLIYDASVAGSQVGPILTSSATTVSNGLFSVALDFGAGIFTGSNYWLAISVRRTGGISFTELNPRQPLLPTPYAIMANSASGLLGLLPAAQLSGTIALAQLPGAVVTNNEAGVTLSNATISGAFSGNGASLTNLNASSNGLVSTNWPLYAVVSTATNVISYPSLLLSNATINCYPPFYFGSYIGSIVMGAFRNPGTNDMAVLSQWGNRVHVFTNAAGVFTSGGSYPIGNGALAVISTDVNGDGYPDLIVNNVTDDSLTILTNTGDGTGNFGLFQTLSCAGHGGTQPRCVVADTLRNSSNIDLLVGYSDSSYLSIYTNNDGPYTFCQQDYEGPGLSAQNLVTSDLLGRGRRDIVMAFVGGTTIGVITNISRSPLTYAASAFQQNLGTSITSIALGTFSGGLPELAVTFYYSNGVNIYGNNGDGTFNLERSIATATGQNALAVGDVNNTGYPGIVSCDIASGSTFTVITNDGTGIMSLSGNYAGGPNPLSPQIADINGDGTPDILVANSGPSTISIYTNSIFHETTNTLTSIPSGNVVGPYTNINLVGQPSYSSEVVSVSFPFTNYPGGAAPPGYDPEYFADLTQSNFNIFGSVITNHPNGGAHSTEYFGYNQTVISAGDIVPITLAFSMYGNEFMIDTMGEGQQPYISIDGIFAPTEANHESYALPPDGNNYYVDVKLAHGGFHTVQVKNVYSVLGVFMPTGNGISPYPDVKVPIQIIGDSITELYSTAFGGGAGNYADYLNADPDFRYCDFWRYGEGGTGWVNTDGGDRTNVFGRTPDITKANTKYLLFIFANDPGASSNTIYSNCFTAMTNIIQQCRPDQKRLLTSYLPLAVQSVPGDAVQLASQAMTNAAFASGFITSPNQYFDWTHPPYITGDFETGTGTAYTFTSPSLYPHPNMLGMQNIYSRIKPFLLSNWPELASGQPTSPAVTTLSTNNGVNLTNLNASAIVPSISGSVTTAACQTWTTSFGSSWIASNNASITFSVPFACTAASGAVAQCWLRVTNSFTAAGETFTNGSWWDSHDFQVPTYYSGGSAHGLQEFNLVPLDNSNIVLFAADYLGSQVVLGWTGQENGAGIQSWTNFEFHIVVKQ